jgi:glycosyltransferase involved in cell wall biosynthesis
MSEISGKLRILQVQNRHAPGWGGEETVVALEKQLLQDRGHLVDDFQVSNLRLKNATIFRQMLAAPGFLWSRRSYTTLRRKIVEFEPDVVHVHNTFPELSPSVFWAARREGVPVVQTLHNFRHVCANSTLFRDGRRCEKCVGNLGWSAIRHGCYADSTARTAVVVARNILHRGLGTYTLAVDAYITLNSFNREIFRRGGIPENKLIAKSNFVPASQLGNSARKPQAIFVGSILPVKGLRLLLNAWGNAGFPGFELLLIGDGAEREALQRQFAHLGNVTWCGHLERSEILARVAESRILVFPGLAYENCPLVVLEALSVGTPVVSASYYAQGAIPTIQREGLQHDREGLLFPTGDLHALTSILQQALHADEETWTRWSNNARQTHAERYSDAVNYQQLMSIYRTVMHPQSAPATEPVLLA